MQIEIEIHDPKTGERQWDRIPDDPGFLELVRREANDVGLVVTAVVTPETDSGLFSAIFPVRNTSPAEQEGLDALLPA